MFMGGDLDQEEFDSLAEEIGQLMAEMMKLRSRHMARMQSLIPQSQPGQMQGQGHRGGMMNNDG